MVRFDRRQTVLIVEDQTVQAEMLARLLGAEGLEIDVVENGEAALQSVARHPPDLVLLDVVLPGLNGVEICRRIKRNLATRLTPVILITGLQGRQHHLAGINAGADDFILKPFDSETLKARVRSLLRLRQYTSELDSAESVIIRPDGRGAGSVHGRPLRATGQVCDGPRTGARTRRR